MQRGWVISPDYRNFIEGLAALRKAEGISQRELARRLGKPPSFINKIELLERRLDVIEFIAIAEAIGVCSDHLLAKLRNSLPDRIVI